MTESTETSVYNAREYWETRLRQSFNLDGVGYRGFGEGINYWLYRVRRHILYRALRKAAINLRSCSVLEIGPGTGFYVDIWKRSDVKRVTGMDITEASTAALKSRFPEYEFVCADIGDRQQLQKYDVVAAFDVLFHIVDDERFEQAIKNVASACAPGAHVLISDSFPHSASHTIHHQKTRTLSDWEDLLAKNGLRIVSRTPIFTFMQTALDTKTRWATALFQWWWRIFRAGALLTSWVPAWGYIFGAALYPLELAASRLMRDGVSIELLVARKLPEDV